MPAHRGIYRQPMPAYRGNDDYVRLHNPSSFPIQSNVRIFVQWLTRITHSRTVWNHPKRNLALRGANINIWHYALSDITRITILQYHNIHISQYTRVSQYHNIQYHNTTRIMLAHRAILHAKLNASRVTLSCDSRPILELLSILISNEQTFHMWSNLGVTITKAASHTVTGRVSRCHTVTGRVSHCHARHA